MFHGVSGASPMPESEQTDIKDLLLILFRSVLIQSDMSMDLFSSRRTSADMEID